MDPAACESPGLADPLVAQPGLLIRLPIRTIAGACVLLASVLVLLSHTGKESRYLAEFRARDLNITPMKSRFVGSVQQLTDGC